MFEPNASVPVDHAAANPPTVILGVAESDAHVVANHILDYVLRTAGYTVVNLGACTSADAFVEAFRTHPNALAVIVGSTNGHAAADLQGLAQAKSDLAIECPVIIGGNLGVTPEQAARTRSSLIELGVDTVLDDIRDLLPVLQRLPKRNAAGPVRDFES